MHRWHVLPSGYTLHATIFYMQNFYNIVTVAAFNLLSAGQDTHIPFHVILHGQKAKHCPTQVQAWTLTNEGNC